MLLTGNRASGLLICKIVASTQHEQIACIRINLLILPRPFAAVPQQSPCRRCNSYVCVSARARSSLCIQMLAQLSSNAVFCLESGKAFGVCFFRSMACQGFQGLGRRFWVSGSMFKVSSSVFRIQVWPATFHNKSNASRFRFHRVRRPRGMMIEGHASCRGLRLGFARWKMAAHIQGAAVLRQDHVASRFAKSLRSIAIAKSRFRVWGLGQAGFGR